MEFFKERLVQWRKDPVTLRIEHPTRIDKARAVGFKAKPGYIVVRQRVQRGHRMHPQTDIGGRRSKTRTQRLDLNKTLRLIAEERASRSFLNCEVLNSYPVGEDGEYKWYEIILVDRCNPHIVADPNINWICNQKNRVFRGKTSSGKRSRGLWNKGKGTEKLRPSKRANLNRRAKSLEYHKGYKPIRN